SDAEQRDLDRAVLGMMEHFREQLAQTHEQEDPRRETGEERDVLRRGREPEGAADDESERRQDREQADGEPRLLRSGAGEHEDRREREGLGAAMDQRRDEGAARRRAGAVDGELDAVDQRLQRQPDQRRPRDGAMAMM